VLLGTPGYMAPEQANGDRQGISPAVDVYALGAVLYECLTGRPPFCGETVLATLDLVRHQEPVTVSRIQPGVPRDLETICMRCLQKQPHKRYASAAELADDLRRFLRREPIRARRVSRAERVAKWARRRPAAAALVAVSLLSSVCLGTGGAVYHVRLAGALAKAELARQNAESSKRKLATQLERARRNVYALQLGQVAQVADTDPGQALALLNDVQRSPADLRDFAWSFLHERCQRGGQMFRGHADAVRCVTAMGNLVAAGGSDGQIALWDLTSGQRLALFAGHKGAVNTVALHPTEPTLASAGDDGTIRLWEANTGKLRQVFASEPGPLNTLTFSHDGRKLAAAGSNGMVSNWDLQQASGTAYTGHDGSVFALALSPDDRLLASGGKDGQIHLWNVERGDHLTLDGHRGWVTCLTVGERYLAAGGSDRQILVWELASGQCIARLAGHAGTLSGVALSSDEERIVSTAYDATLRVWDLDFKRQRLLITGDAEISSLAILHGGGTAVTASLDRNVRSWDLTDRRETVIVGAHDRFITSLALSPDSRQLVSAGGDGGLRAWDIPSGTPNDSWPHSGEAWITALDWQCGDLLAMGDSAGAITIFNTRTGRVERSLPERVVVFPRWRFRQTDANWLRSDRSTAVFTYGTWG
jgi:WD40 repeat protein